MGVLLGRNLRLEKSSAHPREFEKIIKILVIHSGFCFPFCLLNENNFFECMVTLVSLEKKELRVTKSDGRHCSGKRDIQPGACRWPLQSSYMISLPPGLTKQSELYRYLCSTSIHICPITVSGKAVCSLNSYSASHDN